jgi:hypothetical protein
MVPDKDRKAPTGPRNFEIEIKDIFYSAKIDCHFASAPSAMAILGDPVFSADGATTAIALKRRR